MNICILIHNFSFLSHVFTCTYCGRIGHEEKTCYQLHGFPSDSEVSEPQSSIPVINNHNNGSQSQPKNPSEIIETLDPRADKENAYWLYKDPHGD